MSKALWLQQGAALEFFGKSTFVPGLWLASMFFFGVNCWILGIIVGDIGAQSDAPTSIPAEKGAVATSNEPLR